MKKTLSVLFAALMMMAALAGCGNSAKVDPNSPALGTWKTESLEVSGQKLTIDEYKELAGEELGKYGEMKFTFKNDGKVDMKIAEENGSGSWTEEDGKITVKESGVEMELTLADDKMTFEQSGAKFILVKE